MSNFSQASGKSGDGYLMFSPIFSPRKQYLISELMPVTRSPSSTMNFQARAARADVPSP